MLNGTTTRSPTFSLWLDEPVSTTSPMNSCPSTSPLSMLGIWPSIKCKSEPHIAQALTFRITSRASSIFGSGTCRNGYRFYHASTMPSYALLPLMSWSGSNGSVLANVPSTRVWSCSAIDLSGLCVLHLRQTESAKNDSNSAATDDAAYRLVRTTGAAENHLNSLRVRAVERRRSRRRLMARHADKNSECRRRSPASSFIRPRLHHYIGDGPGTFSSGVTNPQRNGVLGSYVTNSHLSPLQSGTASLQIFPCGAKSGCIESS